MVEMKLKSRLDGKEEEEKGGIEKKEVFEWLPPTGTEHRVLEWDLGK